MQPARMSWQIFCEWGSQFADHNCVTLQRTSAHVNLLLPALSAINPADNSIFIEGITTEALPRPKGAALVDDWDCLRVSPTAA